MGIASLNAILRVVFAGGVGADFVRDWIHRPRRIPRLHIRLAAPIADWPPTH